MTSKQVHTTISEEVWKLGVMNGVSWTLALELGIKAMSGIDNDKKKIQDEIMRTEVRLKHLKDLELELDKKESEKKKKEEARVYARL